MKLITLNLEGDRHLDVAIPFFVSETPDILCLQEVFEADVRSIADELGLLHSSFAPMTRRSSYIRDGALHENGVAILSQYPLSNIRSEIYYASTNTLETFDRTSSESIDRTMRRVLITGMVNEITIGTTHFSWTPDGLPSEPQRNAMRALRQTLSAYASLVLCGDFNIPRGVNELYNELTKEFTDVIPKNIRGSIDVKRHRTKDGPAVQERLAGYMVDYILTRGPYSVSDVRQVCGVSDHCAFVATVEAAVP